MKAGKCLNIHSRACIFLFFFTPLLSLHVHTYVGYYACPEVKANETGRYGTTPQPLPRKTFVPPRMMMMMMMGMNTFARVKLNFPDRRKGNVIIRPDTKRSSAKITRPVINILDTDCFPKEGWSTCGAHLWRTVIHRAETPFRGRKAPTEYRFSRCTDEWNVRQRYRVALDGTVCRYLQYRWHSSTTDLFRPFKGVWEFFISTNCYFN